MSLYVNEYGLTMLRTYTSAFMVWLFLTFAWLLITVLRRDENRFAFGSLVAGFACILMLNIANPDALIARTNLSVPRSARDVQTLSTLSADAIPDILPRLSTFSPDGQALLLDSWRKHLSGTDWRSRNLAKTRAGQLVN